jgi:GTP diphosphokinase / guanosine-3',5'-bis(diphosphate) 3'-diphosphatase
MDEKTFLNYCKKQGYSERNIKDFSRAAAFAYPYLTSKKRLAGGSFFLHNLRVGYILAESKTPPEVIIGGLLHGLLNCCSSAELRKEFGQEVAGLVEGVEEVQKIKSQNNQLDAEALRKVLLTTLKDVRVVFIKLANKLDNLRTISPLPQTEQRRVAAEILEIYAPLADRLGADKLKVRLEDLAFRTVHPKKYREIANFLESSREEREDLIATCIKRIEKICLRKTNLLRITGRPKHIYSIYRKMTQRKVQLHEQFDLLGIRIIVESERDCYTLLGLLHENFTPVPDKLKDYIASPKPNFYRSLHTAIYLPGQQVVEVQIRTEEMDELAEEGLAAHWRYKGVKADELFEKKLGWLRGILELQKQGKHKEFLEAAKVDIFGDKIQCYTPKGDVKELPIGATLLDFAFLVHEQIGSHAVGGRVNGKFVPLKQQLKQGDVIEIITNKRQRPRRSWIKLVRSSRARQKIRKSLRKHEKLPAFYYRRLKPTEKESQGVLVGSSAFPKATCVLAKCCRALPGKDIAGILTKRRIISVHAQECRVAKKDEQRWIEVQWKEQFNQRIKFVVEAHERSGLLADLLNTIASAGFEVKEAKAKLVDKRHASCSFLVIPRDLDDLKKLIKRVTKVKGVTRIYFE